MITLLLRITHIIHIAFISLQSSLNDSINGEAISSIHFMASQTAQPGAHYGKGMCVLMSTSCKWLFLLREEWKYFISPRMGAEPRPAFILAHYSGSHGLQKDVFHLCWDKLDSGICCLLVSPWLSHGMDDYLSAARRTCIDVQHSLGF
ncbi:hypothetical protein GOODEAATRI_002792 [Goodea atripinnis]|uniref:Uncharacterized protein n=1 Tax=Goodea atripinnis TaxID=208336 RepID=A0ABV0MY68_9TELE